MNALVMQETELVGDPELVELCLNGDREAFGQIVARYQSLVCALAYSACGDLARSEDLAQETFLAAWRQLRVLKEPAKLKPWLCGIVRNLSQNSVRSQARNPLASAIELEDELAAGPERDAPSEKAMSKEEEAILWRVLETLPRVYRDPLVLYYRSGDSTVEVADALGLSEEAVRQRLARGRAMLNERVGRLVESGLRRSVPNKAFTLAVLAALPVASAQAGVAGTTASAAAQGTAALKTAGGAGTLVATLANGVAVLGGLVGLWGHIENSRSRREHRFLIWSMLGLMVGMAVWVFALVAGMDVLMRYQTIQITTRLSDAIALSLLWLAFAAPLDVYVIWAARRQVRIRAEEADKADRPVEKARRGYRLSMYGAMLAMIFGTTEWLFLLAYRAQDWATVWVLLILGVAGWLVSAHWAVQRPAIRAQVLIALLWGLAFVNLAAANLRWGAWHGGSSSLAPPGVNLLILVIFASVHAGWFLKQRWLATTRVRRDTLVALAIYALIMAAGVRWYWDVKAAEAGEPKVTQIVSYDLQPDGTARFESLSPWRNESGEAVRELRFVNSDFVHVERISDANGASLPFQAEHEGKTFAYTVSMPKPVPPGQTISAKIEGYTTGQIREVAAGEFEYFQQHWPANGVATLRVETYRLPSGARLLETAPADMTRAEMPDNRLELKTQKVIPPNGSITVRLRYQGSRRGAN